MKGIDIDKATQHYHNFRNSCKTLQIATLNEDGSAEISYAPFIWYKDSLYIFISELASHTANLRKNPVASIMLIADEKDSSNLFARERITYHCSASHYPRDKPGYDQILVQMTSVLGKMIKLLSGLQDFHLFRLKPLRGQYVRGFGEAFNLKGDRLDKLEHISRS